MMVSERFFDDGDVSVDFSLAHGVVCMAAVLQ